MKRNLLFSAFLLFGAQQVIAQDVTSGLVSKYSFDNQDVTDEVGSNDGFTSPNPMFVMGYGNTGSAIRFNGYDPSSPIAVADRAGIQSGIISFSDAFTISFWFRVDAFNPVYSRNILTSRKDATGIEAGGIEFNMNAAPVNDIRVTGRSLNPLTIEYNLQTPGIEMTGTWYFMVLTQNPSGLLKLYLNGDQVASAVAGFANGGTEISFADQNDYWAIGSDAGPGQTNSAREFDGLIDELRFYDRELSANEVTQLYNYTPMTVSIDEANPTSGIRVYPNPATDVLNFVTQERLEYTLFDMSGKMVMTGDVNPGQSLDISKLDEGIYVVETRNNQEVNRLKVVKH